MQYGRGADGIAVTSADERRLLTDEAAGLLDPASLLSLAARVEGDNRYNVAKLLRAAALARVLRAADERPPAAPGSAALLDELERLALAFSEDPLLEPLAAPLRRGTELYAVGEVPMLSDVADPLVCRRCGHVEAEGAGFDACAHCGADEATFLVQRAVWWFDRYDARSCLTVLARTAEKLRTLISRVPEHLLNQRPAPHTFSPHEVIAHLRDAQSLLEQRVERILVQDDPDLDAHMLWSWNEGERPTSTEALLDEYVALRRVVLVTLRSAPPEAWWRTGRHREFGRLTLTQQVSYFAAHELTHLRQLRAALVRGAPFDDPTSRERSHRSELP